MGGKKIECGLCFVLEDLIKISNLSLAQLLGPIHSPAFLPFSLLSVSYFNVKISK